MPEKPISLENIPQEIYTQRSFAKDLNAQIQTAFEESKLKIDLVLNLNNPDYDQMVKEIFSILNAQGGQ